MKLTVLKSCLWQCFITIAPPCNRLSLVGAAFCLLVVLSPVSVSCSTGTHLRLSASLAWRRLCCFLWSYPGAAGMGGGGCGGVSPSYLQTINGACLNSITTYQPRWSTRGRPLYTQRFINARLNNITIFMCWLRYPFESATNRLGWNLHALKQHPASSIRKKRRVSDSSSPWSLSTPLKTTRRRQSE